MKPNLLISRCLGFEACRHDGGIIKFPIMELLKKHFNLVTICPEVEMGLPIPRENLRLVKLHDDIRLIQPKTGLDLTEKMQAYAHQKTQSLNNIHGCILKSRSPSCAIQDAKVYAAVDKSPMIQKSSGIFAEILMQKYSNLPVEEEGRLSNLTIREHFYTRVFLSYDFDRISGAGKMADLIEFHAQNKYLYLSYDQYYKNILGQITANTDKYDFESVCKNYKQALNLLLSSPPTAGQYVNSFQHIFGYFSKQLLPQEREFFLSLLAQYQNNQLASSSIANLLKSYAIKTNQQYILKQRIFNPFPAELISLFDSSKNYQEWN